MDEETKYYLIACGTKDYNAFEQLPSVETDLERVIDLFTRDFGYQRVLTDLDINPKKDEITLKFAQWLQQNRRETDIVIFYYSGHGEYILGDRHYLLLEDTDPNLIGQTALSTEDLVRPLNNDGVRIAQILYIIDTCYSQMGAVDVTKFAAGSIGIYRSSKEKSIAVHTIAACRAKQTAKESVFSTVLAAVLKDFCQQSRNRYISPDEIVGKVNEKIPDSMQQEVIHDLTGSQGEAKFFPVIPKTIRTWEEKRLKFTEELLNEFKKHLSKNLLFINSFLLNSKFLEEFILDDLELKEQLKKLSNKPVIEGICPLIACSEWCRTRLLEEDRINPSIDVIEGWQYRVIKYRENADLYKIQNEVRQSWKKFKERINREELRLQIEIEQDLDKDNNTGRVFNSFHLRMNLWIKSQHRPLGRFAENEKIELNSEIESCPESQTFLANLIRKARYSLPNTVKLNLEIFLPIKVLKYPLEEFQFKRGTMWRSLGYEYPVFINSFDRYFDEDFREIRDEIEEIKRALWENNSDLDQKDYYIGTEPSIADLEEIVESLPIAVWSRNANQPMTDNDLKPSEWKNWPDKIKELRRNKRKIALFWDDLYPKPSPRPRPLNTRVVESNGQ
ncbi:caspase family protein [Microcystis sp. M061S2]|uniref:caspase family protein n=1 Tax=Microcystis sp. M061S2 TaxID=2771171 RepID=UPI002583F94B|nr:caspase family protein [Microcystis sp. M061S2]